MRTLLFLLLLLSFGVVSAQGTVYKLKVTSWTCKRSASGVLTASGQVVNQSGVTLKNIRINLRAKDSANVLRGTNSAYIAVRSLANGATSSFRVAVKTTASASKCEIWFRNPDVIQIPTRVPDPQ